MPQKESLNPLVVLSLLTKVGLIQKDPRREKFLSQIENLMKKLPDYAPVDAAVDQKAKDFLHDCLPPVLTPGMTYNQELVFLDDS